MKLRLLLVVMVCPATIGPTEAHLSLVIMGGDEEVVVNNSKVPCIMAGKRGRPTSKWAANW